MGLSDAQQSIMVFLGFLLTALVGWATAGFPTSRLAIGAVVAAILIGAILALKEYLGTTGNVIPTPTPPAVPAVPPTSPASYAKIRAYFTRQPWQF